MNPPISAVLFSVLLLFGMLGMLEIGRVIGLRRRRVESASESESLGAVEAAVFALLGLLMAFTFSGAASRFNEKRMLIADEANAIGTAFLRLDLLAKEARPALRELFRQYADSRIETYRKLPDRDAAMQEMARSTKLQGLIWSESVTAVGLPGAHPSAALLLLPALNAMIDITTTGTTAMEVHLPGRATPWRRCR
jgi:hypothetical protein